MEYNTEDLYWEEETSAWYKTTSQDPTLHYFHNDIISSWNGSTKLFTTSFVEGKKKLAGCVWKRIDQKFIRDVIKKSHYKEDYKGMREYPHAVDCEYGNQATTYESSLGKGNKKRFTLILDDYVYDEVVAEATSHNMRRNVFLNSMIKETIEGGEVSV